MLRWDECGSRKPLPHIVLFAKFFLFDGEELEKVLKGLSSNQSTARLPIKDGIESLLGIPSLKYLSSEIEKMSDNLEKEIKSGDKNYEADLENEEKSKNSFSSISYKKIFWCKDSSNHETKPTS